MPDFLFEISDGVAMLTLNRPERRNAFTAGMLDQWYDALCECASNAMVRAVVLTGTGKAFCAGGDVGRMSQSADTETAFEQKQYIWENIGRIPRFLAQFDKPYLVAVNGVAAGAGMDMALMGDLIFASENARFTESYIRMGLISGDGGAWYLVHAVGERRALEMLWFGDAIDAAEAHRIGLINRVLPEDELLSYTIKVARRLVEGPAHAQAVMKRLVRQARGMSLAAHLDQATSHMGVLKSTADHREALLAFTEKRPARFGGAR